jgi:hypothetical protein
MRASAKLGLVAAGYVGAFVVAAAVVLLYVTWTAGPDRQASGGMYAFGDSFLFFAVFGVAAVLPTAAGLFFLRPYHSFWRVLALAALVIAATGLASLAVCVAARTAHAGPAINSWSAFAVLRVLVAPLIALAFLVCGAFAPLRPARLALCAATISEAVVFTYWLIQLPR